MPLLLYRDPPSERLNYFQPQGRVAHEIEHREFDFHQVRDPVYLEIHLTIVLPDGGIRAIEFWEVHFGCGVETRMIDRSLKMILLPVPPMRVVVNDCTIVRGKSMRSRDLRDLPPCVVVDAVPIGPSRRRTHR